MEKKTNLDSRSIISAPNNSISHDLSRVGAIINSISRVGRWLPRRGGYGGGGDLKVVISKARATKGPADFSLSLSLSLSLMGVVCCCYRVSLIFMRLAPHHAITLTLWCSAEV